jgi:hypothetical protein
VRTREDRKRKEKYNLPPPPTHRRMGSAYNPDGKSYAHAFFFQPVCVLVSHATGHFVPKSDGKFGEEYLKRERKDAPGHPGVDQTPKSESTDNRHDGRANISGSGRSDYA